MPKVSIESIDDELVSIVCYTANAIMKVKGHAITAKPEEVRITLQALRLVNDLMKKKEEKC